MPRIRARALPLVIGTLVGGSLVGAAQARPPSPPDCRNWEHATTCVGGGDGGIGVGVGSGQGAGGGSSGGDVVDPGVVYEYAWVMTCSSNVPGAGDTACTAALTSCPKKGDVRYWIYRRVVHDDGTTGPWMALPGSYCRGADAPGVPTGGSIVRAFRWEFVPIAGSVVATSPPGDTLVHLPTVVYADTPPTITPRVRILGRTVVLTLHPTRWTWDFGDGSGPLVTRTPGAPYPSSEVTHRYAGSGSVEVSVAVTWAGTFSLGRRTFAIPGSVAITGPSTALAVRSAQAQLVTGG